MEILQINFAFKLLIEVALRSSNFPTHMTIAPKSKGLRDTLPMRCPQDGFPFSDRVRSLHPYDSSRQFSERILLWQGYLKQTCHLL